MYRVELKESQSNPCPTSIRPLLFLMYRVELKAKPLEFPNAPLKLQFLMYRVELKEFFFDFIDKINKQFLMYRVS